ncbi:hypothetical protein FKP32DRAFT_324631 [Trametes sanguinea]|nr:hypothetical protein FKP32DRAFT_324631 [Trametes sanguinea]
MMTTAVSAAWQEPYTSTGNVLESVLEEYMRDQNYFTPYPRYAFITQSSGSGKSRMVDELAKTIFCIPMCLGSKQAYPPPDIDLLNWFGPIRDLNANRRTVHVQLFLCSLFETALERVKLIASDPASHGGSLASSFRRLMSEGMEYGRHGLYRQKFYADVCKRATELTLLPGSEIRQCDLSPEVNVVDEGGQRIYVRAAAEALTSYLATVQQQSSATNDGFPNVILCFDEAQLLTGGARRHSGMSLFSDVRHALRLVSQLPIFALFLSTVGKLEQFSPPPPLKGSARVFQRQLVPYPPITWAPIDALAARITNNKVWTLTEVASTYHIAHLGRPLFPAMYDAALAAGDDTVNNWIIEFACQKLLKAQPPADLSNQQTLACIAVRIPIQFNAAPLLPPSTEDADLERKLVADHMRLLLKAGVGFSPFITTSASEPLLAEAASSLMIDRRWSNGKARELTRRGGLDPLAAATHHVGKSLLALGARGEFAAALLLLYARDRATTFDLEPPYPGAPSDDHVPDPKCDGAHRRRIVTVDHFLEALLGEERYKTCAASVPCAYHAPEYATTPLGAAFRDGFVYFNHFIKAQSYELVNQQYLVLAISRGAAIICADGHLGIDIVVPVLLGTKLKKEQVTAILVRAKNGPQYGARVQSPLLESMNPYTSGLFDRAVKEPPPVLRMVFALASPEAAVAVPAAPAPQSPRRDKTAAFTAYDIWCAGASHEAFDVIQEDEDGAFASLLNAMRTGARDAAAQTYLGEPASVRRTMRQMRPLVSTDRESIELFADVEGLGFGECARAEDAEEGAIE